MIQNLRTRDRDTAHYGSFDREEICNSTRLRRVLGMKAAYTTWWRHADAVLLRIYCKVRTQQHFGHIYRIQHMELVQAERFPWSAKRRGGRNVTVQQLVTAESFSKPRSKMVNKHTERDRSFR